MVLAISEQEGEDSGNTEAYGATPDCYTELGDLEKAVAAFADTDIVNLIIQLMAVPTRFDASTLLFR
ncbi:hypothetical protein V6N13_016634 [Hibiscus sabdariffa]